MVPGLSSQKDTWVRDASRVGEFHSAGASKGGTKLCLEGSPEWG